MLGKLQESDLKLKLDKCHFVPQVEYLGHIIRKEGLSSNVDKLAAIMYAPVSQDVMELQVSWDLSIFIVISFPLHLLLCDRKKWQRGQQQPDAFTACKHLVTRAPVLVHFLLRGLCATAATHRLMV